VFCGGGGKGEVFCGGEKGGVFCGEEVCFCGGEGVFLGRGVCGGGCGFSCVCGCGFSCGGGTFDLIGGVL
tara:strand:+ start:2069 stop:2278 length:210 start_codon:yes stop_codon:yes gene_type:complete